MSDSATTRDALLFALLLVLVAREPALPGIFAAGIGAAGVALGVAAFAVRVLPDGFGRVTPADSEE
ncbi:hypothetical protein [Halosegnis marinus]|uniref:Uncharacterized protein n=1 Tax=Halosegnis marinus TaxID=3034023 RepID=A0ABD5ZKD3_9EURY|nr:hypothetical protein [Halosegnis sp. DT85]